MDAAAVKAFINSDGEKNEFAFDGTTNTVYSGDEVIFTYDEPIENDVEEENEIDTPKEEKKSGAAIGIIGGADGPTAVVLANDAYKALIVPIIICILIAFAIGFAVGYFVRNRKQ